MANGLVKTFERLPQIGEGFFWCMCREWIVAMIHFWAVIRWTGGTEGLMAVVYIYLLVSNVYGLVKSITGLDMSFLIYISLLGSDISVG